MGDCDHIWSAEEYEVIKSRVCSACNEYEISLQLRNILKERDNVLNLLTEAYKELSSIDAITVSPSGVDGLLDLVNRIKKHLISGVDK